MTPRRRDVPVGKFDVTTGRWTDIDAAGAVDRDELTLATFNVWYDSYHAEQRYIAIAEMLSRNARPTSWCFKKSPRLRSPFSSPSPGSGSHYLRAAVTGAGVGNYGMLILSRLPIADVDLHPVAHPQGSAVSCRPK